MFYCCSSAEQPINEAVITVPPYFNQAERRAMSRAAELAGLRLLQLLNDNTAGAYWDFELLKIVSCILALLVCYTPWKNMKVNVAHEIGNDILCLMLLQLHWIIECFVTKFLMQLHWITCFLILEQVGQQPLLCVSRCVMSILFVNCFSNHAYFFISIFYVVK